jgi:hypothetical protein
VKFLFPLFERFVVADVVVVVVVVVVVALGVVTIDATDCDHPDPSKQQGGAPLCLAVHFIALLPRILFSLMAVVVAAFESSDKGEEEIGVLILF